MSQRAKRLLNTTITYVGRLYIWLLSIQQDAASRERMRVQRAIFDEAMLLERYRRDGYSVGPRGEA